MTTSGWRKVARQRIADTLIEYEAQCLLLDQPMDQKVALKQISQAYPFHQREMHPYKQWLKEVAIARAFLKCGYQVREYWAFAERYERVQRGYNPNKPGRLIKPVEGQISLF